jgi:Ca-activated chloride channel family protein
MNAKKLFTALIAGALLMIFLAGCGFSLSAAEERSNQEPGDHYYRDKAAEEPANEINANEWEPGLSGGEAGLSENNRSPMDSTAGQAESLGESAPSYDVSPPIPPIQYPDDTNFEDYGVNPFIDSEDDNLSTFAADVDTGSYTIARSYITQGMLPPEDSVRIEEYINYFPQDYRRPSAREVFSINIDGSPTPFTESDRYQVIRIGIQGYEVPEDDRKDAALTFVIDVSGSMGNDNRLEMVQDSLELLVDQLRPSDTVGIIAYTDTAWVVLPHTSARNKGEIAEAIYSLYPMASTNAEAGLILGYRVAERAFIPGGINRVILCSDGVANVGNTGSDSIWESIEDSASEGITLTTIGVGMGNYNDVLLEQLADQGNGNYAYVDSMDEANRLFVDELVSTLQVIAFDAKIQVVFNPEVVTRYRLIGFENRAIDDDDFRDNKVDAAEIGAGHSVTALYEIKLANRARGEIATVLLRWKDADSLRVKERSETFETRDLENSFYRTSPYFQMDVLVAEFGEILRDSYWADETSFWDLLEYAEEAAYKVERTEFLEFLELLEQTARMY